jgi:hypothetical protein
LQLVHHGLVFPFVSVEEVLVEVIIIVVEEILVEIQLRVGDHSLLLNCERKKARADQKVVQANHRRGDTARGPRVGAGEECVLRHVDLFIPVPRGCQ